MEHLIEKRVLMAKPIGGGDRSSYINYVGP